MLARRLSAVSLATAWLTTALLATPLLASVGARAAEPERVQFPSHDADLTQGAPTQVQAMLFRPDRPGPWPLVIALHGCGGLWSHSQPGQMDARSRDYAERLTRQGYAVLFPDSFTSRQVKEVCTASEARIRPGIERARDVWGAIGWAAGQHAIRADRMALLGWSHGGSTTLFSIWPDSHAAPKAAHARPIIAIAFYPGCRGALEEKRRWWPGMPLTILMGTDDNWTPPGYCRDLVARAQASGHKAEIVLYPGAFHDFDQPDMKIHTRSGVNTPSGSVQMGTDPVARADAQARVDALLAASIGRP